MAGIDTQTECVRLLRTRNQTLQFRAGYTGFFGRYCAAPGCLRFFKKSFGKSAGV